MNVHQVRGVCAALVCAALAVATTPLAAEVVAKLNGAEITDVDLALAEADIGQALADLPPPAKKRVLVEYLIELRLFAAAAEAEKLASGDEFERRAAYWRLRAMRDAFFEKKVKGQVGDDMGRKIYDEKVKQLGTEEEIRARHILVDSEAKAKELAEAIAKGGDFAALARENSKDKGSAVEGGDLGYFGRGQMVAPFEEAAFKLAQGQVSAPVQSQFGWHIIKLEEKRQKKPPSYEEVKDHLVTNLVRQKAQEEAAALRAKAQIEYLDPEVKKQVEEDQIKAQAQQKMMEEQIKAQIEKMEKEGKAPPTLPAAEPKADGAPAPAPAPAP